MPELPEVETIRRQLAEKITGKMWQDKEIIGVRRKAKMLFINFADGSSLVFHLKLTGQLIFNGHPGRFTRAVFDFSDGSCLIFNDVRKFGWWKVVENPEEIKEVKQLGPEALEITEEEFQALFKKKQKAKIKPLLMDQKFIAGLGNIYADEILFAAGVRPVRLSKDLSQEEIKRIFVSMKRILSQAIKKGGSSVEDYLDAFGKKGDYVSCHKVYQRTGLPCKKCGKPIERTKIIGRSAHFCPKCQI